MDDAQPSGLSRREGQIMDVLHRRGHATAAEVLEALPDPPGYSSVRKLLEILEQRGLVRHERDGRRYVYHPVNPERARRSAAERLFRTFFRGSLENTVQALIEVSGSEVSDEELERVIRLASDARRKGR